MNFVNDPLIEWWHLELSSGKYNGRLHDDTFVIGVIDIGAIRVCTYLSVAVMME